MTKLLAASGDQAASENEQHACPAIPVVFEYIGWLQVDNQCQLPANQKCFPATLAQPMIAKHDNSRKSTQVLFPCIFKHRYCIKRLHTPTFHNPALTDYVQRRMENLSLKCSEVPVVTEAELASLPSQLRLTFLNPGWSPQQSPAPHRRYAVRLSHLASASLSAASMRCCATSLGSRRSALAALSTTQNEADIDLVAQMSVKTVLTMKREQPLDAQWFAFRAAVCNVFGARSKLERCRCWPR
jgi:hypothetical protein